MRNKKEVFLEDAQKIKELGYRVFVSARGTYGWVVNDADEIGYFQQGDYGFGIVFSTLHYGAKSLGTGFGLDNWDETHSEFTHEIVDRCFAHHPHWAHRWCRTKEERDDLEKIKKYTASKYFENYWDKENVVEL